MTPELTVVTNVNTLYLKWSPNLSQKDSVTGLMRDKMTVVTKMLVGMYMDYE